MTTTTVLRTYTDGVLRYEGADLERAIRVWDAATFSAGRQVPGGIAVAVYEGDPKYPSGLLQLRDGWLLHVREDGSVYLHPTIHLTEGVSP